MGFDGSSPEGFSRISESDTLLRPDPSTYQPLPFDEDSGIQTARMFCDITMPDGDPLFADPREVLRRRLNAARYMGFEFVASPEIEFYVVKPDAPGEAPTPAEKGGYFDQAKRNEAPKLRRQTVSALEYMGIVSVRINAAGLVHGIVGHETDSAAVDTPEGADEVLGVVGLDFDEVFVVAELD